MSETKRAIGTWVRCGSKRGGCDCGEIWDQAADRLVATVHMHTEDGDWTREAMLEHADLIASAPDLAREHAEMLALLRDAGSDSMCVCRDGVRCWHCRYVDLHARIDAREKDGAR